MENSTRAEQSGGDVLKPRSPTLNQVRANLKVELCGMQGGISALIKFRAVSYRLPFFCRSLRAA